MSTTGVPVDEEELRLLLIGDRADRERAFELIHAHRCVRVCARLRERFPGLPSADLPGIWQETLIDLLEAVQDGRFDANRPLDPYLWTIAKARATDRLRRRTTRGEAEQEIAAALPESEFAVLSPPERAELREFLRLSVARLPHKQRVVLQVWIDGHPETTDMQLLRREVSLATGEEETLAAVKRALQEARRKAREFLTRKGYGTGSSS